MSTEEEYKKRCEDKTKDMLAMGILPIDVADFWADKYIKCLSLLASILEKEIGNPYIKNT